MDHSDKNYLHKTIPTSTNILKPLNNLLRHTKSLSVEMRKGITIKYLKNSIF